jgi:hypothetical protein
MSYREKKGLMKRIRVCPHSGNAVLQYKAPDDVWTCMHSETVLQDEIDIQKFLQDTVIGYFVYDGSVKCSNCLPDESQNNPPFTKIYAMNVHPYTQICHHCSKKIYDGTADMILFERQNSRNQNVYGKDDIPF